MPGQTVTLRMIREARRLLKGILHRTALEPSRTYRVRPEGDQAVAP